MSKPYKAPALTPYGSVTDVTRASFNNTQQDSVFWAGLQVGVAQGSMDACVSLNPQSPNGTCLF